MLKLYPIRSTDFNALPEEANAEAFPDNLAKIEAVIASESKPVVWAACGENIFALKFFVEASKELFSLGKAWHFVATVWFANSVRASAPPISFALRMEILAV